jgi:hypothetical protein
MSRSAVLWCPDKSTANGFLALLTPQRNRAGRGMSEVGSSVCRHGRTRIGRSGVENFAPADPDAPVRGTAFTGTVRCLAGSPGSLCASRLRPLAPRAGGHRLPLLRPRPRRCRRPALATPGGQPEQRRRVVDPARGRAIGPHGPAAPRAGRVAVMTAGSAKA